MTTFCLMHSSGQGPAGWQLLVDELAQRGHRALTPAFDLDQADEGLAFHAETIVQALNEAGHAPADVVVVAHSAAGMYLPLVVERWRPRRMVFLAALVPRPGLSAWEQFQTDPTLFNPAWIGKNPLDEEVAREFVFHDCPPERLAWALATRVLFYAKRAMQEPCPLTTWPSVPAGYIVCAEDRTITPAWQRKAAREFLGVEPVELPGGHCPNVSRPAALAEILDKLTA
jgi:pimeloyl-ACP methyl ester carboxylesterase